MINSKINSTMFGFRSSPSSIEDFAKNVSSGMYLDNHILIGHKYNHIACDILSR